MLRNLSCESLTLSHCLVRTNLQKKKKLYLVFQILHRTTPSRDILFFVGPKQFSPDNLLSFSHTGVPTDSSPEMGAQKVFFHSGLFDTCFPRNMSPNISVAPATLCSQ